MIKEIKMPNLGTTTNDIRITRWLKQENDFVKRGEMLFEIETDKAVMEVESYLVGYLKKIVVGNDSVTTTGSVVAYMGDEQDVYEDKEAGSAAAAQSETDAGITANKEAAARISPMVKKIAEKMGVDYTKISGTGPNGMITKEDVENAAKGAGPKPGNLVPFDRIGQATAKAMTQSKTTIPHVYFTVEVDATAMVQARKAAGKAISYNAMIIKAVADCIKEYPYLAAKFTEEGRILADKLNIGLAVARGNDLLVPVVADAGNAADLAAIEQQVKALVSKVNDNKLQQNDLTGGVFTVTNLGGFGIESFSAIINPPEAGILAVGAMIDRVVAVNGEIKILPMMKLTLSVDHRIVNGAYAAGFLQALKLNLERV